MLIIYVSFVVSLSLCVICLILSLIFYLKFIKQGFMFKHLHIKILNFKQRWTNWWTKKQSVFVHQTILFDILLCILQMFNYMFSNIFLNIPTASPTVGILFTLNRRLVATCLKSHLRGFLPTKLITAANVLLW